MNWIMELIRASSHLGKHAVSNLLQQSNPVYSTEVWKVAPLKVGAGREAGEQLVEERDS